MTKKEELKVKKVEAKLDNLKTYVITAAVSGVQELDYFVVNAQAEDDALEKVARLLYDREEYGARENSFEEFLANCIHNDTIYILDYFEPVEVF